MANFRVGLDKDGSIIAGTKTKNDTWNNKSIVTEEALAAVRDHLIVMAQKESCAAYKWDYTNGKTIILSIEEKDTAELNKQENK